MSSVPVGRILDHDVLGASVLAGVGAAGILTRFTRPHCQESLGPYHVRVFAGDSADDAIVGAVTEIQGQVATWLDTIGVWWILAAFTLTAGIAVALRAARRANGRRSPVRSGLPSR